MAMSSWSQAAPAVRGPVAAVVQHVDDLAHAPAQVESRLAPKFCKKNRLLRSHSALYACYHV
jgi:hypothetical protein